MSQHGIRFGTDGWRAIIAEGFTFENVEIVASGVARYLLQHFSTQKPVVIGYDTRFMADRFATLAAEVLRSFGFSVLLTESYTPTPIVAFAAKAYDTAGALMFTASHNPPEYCGIKFIPHYAGPATPEITDALLAEIRTLENDSSLSRRGSTQGTLEFFNPLERYVAFLSEHIDFEILKAHPLKILYDPMYGAGQGYLDGIFKAKTGYTMDSLHHQRDPLFGGQIPEPKAECLPELMHRVKAEGYDLGFANDGDADRFGIVDEQGHYLSANQIIPLLFRYLYQRRGYRGSVVRTVATSMLLDSLADRYGVTVHETPVGFKYVGEWMRKEAVIIGGEESGGLSILGHIPEKDGILADLLVAEMVAAEGKPLSQLYEALQEEAGCRLHELSINLHRPEAEKKAIMSALQGLRAGQTFAGRPIEKIDDRDGIKLIFAPYDWMLVRPSGTEPILRLYAESRDQAILERYPNALESLLAVPQAR